MIHFTQGKRGVVSGAMKATIIAPDQYGFRLLDTIGTKILI